jgi:hypothetical protein
MSGIIDTIMAVLVGKLMIISIDGWLETSQKRTMRNNRGAREWWWPLEHHWVEKGDRISQCRLGYRVRRC